MARANWVTGAGALGTAFSLALFIASPAAAATLTSGSWTEFGFGASGSALYDFANGPTDTTFTTGVLATNTELEITDAFYPGDNFNIIVTQGVTTVDNVTTPAVPFNGSIYVGPPLDTQTIFNTAFSDGLFSTYTILLAAGFSYDITGTVVTSPEGSGEGAFELVATPVPSSWILMLAGLVSLGFFAYRRSAKRSSTFATA